jgi:hypothetical protein
VAPNAVSENGLFFHFAISIISNTKHLEHIGRGLTFDGAQRKSKREKIVKEENKNKSQENF